MKKLILVVALAAITFGAQAQGKMRIGLKGAFNSTWLFNKNVSDQGFALDYAPTTGGSFGATFNYMLSESYSVDVNLLISGHNEKYDLNLGTEANPIAGTVEDKLKYIDIPVLFKLGNGHSAYFEVGPQLSFLSSASETKSNDKIGSVNYVKKDFKKDFSGFGLSGVLGFGADIKLTDELGLNVGLRLGYMFTDATVEKNSTDVKTLSANPKSNSFDSNAAADNISLNATFNHTTSDNKFDYKPTTRAWAGLNIGLTYMLK